MNPGRRRAAVILGLLLLTTAIGTGLIALESRLAPLPGPDNPYSFDETVTRLEASTLRWQRFYLPALEAIVVLGVALCGRGRGAWLECLAASPFVFSMVGIEHMATSLGSAETALAVYVVLSPLAAALLRWLVRGGSGQSAA